MGDVQSQFIKLTSLDINENEHLARITPEYEAQTDRALHNKIVLRASVSNTLVEHFSHIVEQYLKRYLD